MRGIDHRNAKARPRRRAQFRRIGKVAVQHVRPGFHFVQHLKKGGSQAGQLGLQRLFCQVVIRWTLQTQDGKLWAEVLPRQRVVAAQLRCDETPGHDIDARDIALSGLSSCRAQNIGDMAAGVLRQAIADRRRPDAATQRNMHYIHWNLVIAASARACVPHVTIT